MFPKDVPKSTKCRQNQGTEIRRKIRKEKKGKHNLSFFFEIPTKKGENQRNIEKILKSGREKTTEKKRKTNRKLKNQPQMIDFSPTTKNLTPRG